MSKYLILLNKFVAHYKQLIHTPFSFSVSSVTVSANLNISNCISVLFSLAFASNKSYVRDGNSKPTVNDILLANGTKLKLYSKNSDLEQSNVQWP